MEKLGLNATFRDSAAFESLWESQDKRLIPLIERAAQQK